MKNFIVVVRKDGKNKCLSTYKENTAKAIESINNIWKKDGYTIISVFEQVFTIY